MREMDALRAAGLSEAESKVYFALLSAGPSGAGELIRKTGLHRGTAYQVLERLKEKGFVSSIVTETKHCFEAADPQRLMDELKEKEEMLAETLPKMKARIKEGIGKQSVLVYTGVRGTWAVFEEMAERLKHGGTYYDFGVSGLFREVMKSYWDLWQKRKRKYRIKSKVIFNEEVTTTNPALIKDYFGDARFHPKEYPSMTDTIIYEDTVVLFLWTAKPPIAVVVRNSDNAKSYMNQFKLMWKYCKRKKN